MNTYRINGLPWSSGIGTDVTDCRTAKEVMEKANLNFGVSKCKVNAAMPINLFTNNIDVDKLAQTDFIKDGTLHVNIPEAYATYRTDNYAPLGLVKSKYEVVQNTDAFSFFDEAIGIDNCNWQYAGAFGFGERVFVVAKIGMSSKVKINNFNDTIDNYLVFVNTHDGSGSLTVMFTPVRLFCLNCLNAALSKNSANFRLRHTTTVNTRLHKGSEILKMTYEHAKNASELYNSLGKITMKDSEVLEYIANLVLDMNEKLSLLKYDYVNGYTKLLNRDINCLESTKISMRKANTIANMYDYYFAGVEQAPIVGTAWGSYNAITGYYSNVANLEGEKRMDSLLFGNAQNVTQNALSFYKSYKVA